MSRARSIAAALVPALALAGFALAWSDHGCRAQESGAPPAAKPPPDDKPAPSASPAQPEKPAAAELTHEELAKRRAERLAKDKEALAADLAVIDAFGRVDQFRDALRELGAKCDPFPPGTERWVKIGSDGWLPMMAIDHWLQWHLPAPGSSVPLALDVDVTNHPFGAIVDLSNQLHEHDVEFVMVVFPSRIQLHPDLVMPGLGELKTDKFRGMVGATVRFLQLLNERGVETINLATPFVAERSSTVKDEEGKVVEDGNGDLYLARNKHWTPRAAELAARVVAQRLRDMPWFTPGPSKEGTDYEIQEKVVRFTSTAGGESPDHTPERIQMHQLLQLHAPVSPRDMRRAPIVVLSDSFAKFYSEEGSSASFSDQLRRFTGWPIDSIAPMGGGEMKCREVVAQRGDKLRGKKVVIWLLQEDNLRPVPGYAKLDLFK